MLYSMHLPPSRLLLGLLYAACAMLAACGWRLQGATRLPESAAIVYVDAMDPYSEFSRALKRSLQQAGARVVEHRAEAAAVIKVRKDSTGQAVQSVSAKNIPQEYSVFYQIEYAVEVSGKEAIEPQKISLSRTYSYNESAMLGKMEEESVLRAALARDLADQVLRRMAALR
jgi:LPS-assembly lipoprotein